MKSFRAGLIVPWMNTALEDELPELLPSAIGLHWARMSPEEWPRDSHDETYLASMMADAVRARRSFTGIALNEIIVACTSLSFAADANSELTHRASAENWLCVRDTIVESWLHRGGAPAALLGPYGTEVLEAAATSFSHAGIPILGVVPIPYEAEIKDIDPVAIIDLILREDLPVGSSVIVSCTALYTASIPYKLQENGREDLRFISSNLSIVDHLIRAHLR